MLINYIGILLTVYHLQSLFMLINSPTNVILVTYGLIFYFMIDYVFYYELII